jgi:epoxide hydrolase 4
MTAVFRECSVVAGGVRFHCATAGKGPLVVLLHGFPERWMSWKQQIPALAAAGYRVVAPDLRGYGESERTETGYDLRSLAQDVASMIVALGEDRATVIGHDWGGGIAWEAASRFPHRVVRCASLNCPHPAVLDEVFFRSAKQFMRSRYMLFFCVPWVSEWWLARDGGRSIFKRFHGVGRPLPPEFADILRTSLHSRESVRPMLEYYRQAVRASLSQRVGPYDQIMQPSLLLWGENDAVLGNELLAPHTRYARNLTLRRIPQCGHFVQQERPDAVNAILLEWLTQTASATR